ncbi:MAG TPA: histidinol-phosphatase HisJ family protein [Desulfobacteraceae bacterium]|nr:histidinol-phosphatase HisJ family protein [Desulfobacteraceae bacterium]
MIAADKLIPLPDYHIHTHLCRHADGEPSLYRTAAAIQGIPEICFTDHCPYPDGYDPLHRMEIVQFNFYRQMITELQDEENPLVLFGIEADYYSGCEEFLGNWLPAQGFDFVLGSVHYIGNWGFDNPDQKNVWDSIDVKSAWKEYFRLIGRLADTRLFDTVGHLDLPKKFGHRPHDKILKEMAQPVLDKIAKSGMGIELNTSGLRKPVGEIYPSPLLLSLAYEREIPICFGSDAHTPEEVGAGFGQALTLAHEIGYKDCFVIRQRNKQIISLP